jgi:hypothetical protein
MDIREAEQVFKFVGWQDVLDSADGTQFGVILNGEPTVATKVHSENKADEDYERDLVVIVEINGQYYRKTGYGMVGSHCYGDYEPSWNSGLEEVTPQEQTVVVYETVRIPRETTVTKYV